MADKIRRILDRLNTETRKFCITRFLARHPNLCVHIPENNGGARAMEVDVSCSKFNYLFNGVFIKHKLAPDKILRKSCLLRHSILSWETMNVSFKNSRDGQDSTKSPNNENLYDV